MLTATKASRSYNRTLIFKPKRLALQTERQPKNQKEHHLRRHLHQFFPHKNAVRTLTFFLFSFSSWGEGASSEKTFSFQFSLFIIDDLSQIPKISLKVQVSSERSIECSEMHSCISQCHKKI